MSAAAAAEFLLARVTWRPEAVPCSSTMVVFREEIMLLLSFSCITPSNQHPTAQSKRTSRVCDMVLQARKMISSGERSLCVVLKLMRHAMRGATMNTTGAKDKQAGIEET